MQGRGASHKKIFEQNGRRAAEILRHSHFLQFLRYFIYGPNLPQRIVTAFRDEVAPCGDVASGDVGQLRAFARDQARWLERKDGQVAEEFHKLALDCGMDVAYARSIRDAVKQVRQRR